MSKILLVDDEPSILRTLEIALQHHGHEVCTAHCPDAALERVAAWRPDLVILDVMMPSGTEGFQTVWRIRQLDDEALRAIPIVMATGLHEHTEMRFYPDETDGTYTPGEFLPIQGWLDKPVRPQDLLAKIKQLLG
jgi:CheY-like chemotaxis protein